MSRARNAIESLSHTIKTIPKRISLSRKISPLVKVQLESILAQYESTLYSAKKISSRHIISAMNQSVGEHISHLSKSKSMTPDEYNELLQYLESMNIPSTEGSEIEGLSNKAKAVRSMVSFLANNALNLLGIRAIYDQKAQKTKLVQDLRRKS